MLHSPFSWGSPARSTRALCPHYLSSALDSKPTCTRQAWLPAAGRLTARQKRFGDRGGGPLRPLLQMRAIAADSYRTLRKRYPHLDSTTRLAAAALPIPCPAG